MNTRLVTYRSNVVSTGVISAGNYSEGTGSIVSTSGGGADPQIAFNIGDIVVTTRNKPLGTVTSTGVGYVGISPLQNNISMGDYLSVIREETYEMDLQANPSVSLNYQFADIKEPDKRKASYSQTFKLPFTDNNNEFFQNWYNVNMTTLIFNTREKFNAVLFVGTVPQFEGVIELKAIYQKAQVYEIVLLSNSADLFTLIGKNKLKDIFLNEDGSYSEDLNHKFSSYNIKESWDGASTSFVNVPAGVSLQDSDSNVQKVMYPLNITRPKFYYDGVNSNRYLAMNNPSEYTNDVQNDYSVQITQLRPSIQIKELFKLIMARAGFSYTSAFIDGDYFGNLYMTTCNHIVLPTTPTLNTTGQNDGTMIVGNTGSNWGNYDNYNDCDNEPNWTICPANQVTPTTNYTFPTDSENLWNEANSSFTRLDNNMNMVNVKFSMSGTNIGECNGDMRLRYRIQMETDGAVNWNGYYSSGNIEIDTNASTGELPSTFINIDIDLGWMPVNEKAFIVFKPINFNKLNPSIGSTLRLGNSGSGEFAGLYNLITLNWVGYGTNIYNRTVDIPSCIDDSITQKDFLKDLISRFNLVVLSDPNNANNIIIEPYNEYLSNGSSKDWTKKIDLSKEIIVKDTTSMQKSSILLSDLEDVDMWNKSIKEEQPTYNPYGKLEITETNNAFATGEMKNDSLFSPYINEKVFRNQNDQLPTYFRNVVVHYEYTYKQNGSSYENTLEATNPKLFYYSGVPSILQVAGSPTNNYYLHRANTTGGVFDIEFTTFPLCTAWELTTDVNGEATLETTTKSLYWNQAPPIAGNLNCFNYNQNSVLGLKSLYYEYWESYLNSVYHIDARIMECYLNLDSVDILNFKFSDEIFIKDNYWRILNISNYQVGGKVSTKVTLIKASNFYSETCDTCNYIPGNLNGNNTIGPYFIWCPIDNPTCTPLITAPPYTGFFADEQSCLAAGGTPFTNASNWAPLYLCLANSGSLPINLATTFSPKSIFSTNGTKTLISGKVNGYNKPLIIGNDNNKYSQSLIPHYGNDIVIKYNTNPKSIPQLNGESHKLILSGYTIANTKSYAYMQGDENQEELQILTESNIVLRVKGISTVIGGTSSTYTVGSTEAFAYYTAFKNIGSTAVQLGTAGGTVEFSLKESGAGSVCSLYIDMSSGVLRFGLQDSQTDTKRIWQLSVQVDVNSIGNISIPFDEDWALFQNGRNIEFENENYLIWN